MLNEPRQRRLPCGASPHPPDDAPGPAGRAIAYVLMGYPRLSETFIASELLRVERAGVALRLFVIKPVEEHERGLRNPVVDAIATRPEYLPDPSGLTRPMHDWRPRDLRGFGAAALRAARARPRGFVRAVAAGLWWSVRDRPSRWAPPRKIHVKELLQAIALAARLLDAPEVCHLHAHFAHGTTTVAWRAAQIVGLPFSFTGHARDIYAPELNPHGLLRRKLRAASFAVTCTEANRRHLAAIAPDAEVHRIYHGLTADVATAVAGGAQRVPANGRLRVLGVGRLVPKKGFDVLIEACAALRRDGVPFEARIVGQEGGHAPALRERVAALGLQDVLRFDGPMDQAALARAYRAADVVCLPCRLLPNDRDGIPNVLVEAMACGTPVVSTAVSAIPELVRDGENGILVAPDDPEALAAALARLHHEPGLARRLAAAGEATVRECFDGEQMAGELADLFERHVLRTAQLPA